MVTHPAVIRLISKSHQVTEEDRVVAGIDLGSHLNGADVSPDPLLRRLGDVGERVLHLKLR